MTSAPNALYIAFHMKNTLNTSAEAASLGVFLEKIFGVAAVETVDLDWSQDREVIFKLIKPILEEKSAEVEFFQKIKRLFEETEDYHPHFTQLYN